MAQSQSRYNFPDSPLATSFWLARSNEWVSGYATAKRLGPAHCWEPLRLAQTHARVLPPERHASVSGVSSSPHSKALTQRGRQKSTDP